MLEREWGVDEGNFYDFDAQYIPGKSNLVPDAISRHPLPTFNTIHSTPIDIIVQLFKQATIYFHPPSASQLRKNENYFFQS